MARLGILSMGVLVRELNGMLVGFVLAAVLWGWVGLPNNKEVWMTDCLSIVDYTRNGQKSLKVTP